MNTTTAPRAIKPVRAPRVTLASVTTKPHRLPPRVLLYSTEGLGKTTFAAHAPSPIFICPEDGIPPALGEVARFEAPVDGWTWPDVLDAVRALATDAHEFKTLVIDTLDWIEPLLWDHICAEARVATIEEVGGGYGKGYVAALDGWRSLIAGLEKLRSAKGMTIILLGHARVKAHKMPNVEAFDRYELKINDKAAGVWKEWCDAVLFGRHEDLATKDAKTKRVRGVSTGARIVHATHDAAWDAKNRYGLPDEFALDWDEFTAGMSSGASRASALRESIAAHLATIADEALAAKVKPTVEQAGDDAAQLARINNRLATLASSKEQG